MPAASDKPTEKAGSKDAEAAVAGVQEKVDREHEQGFRGREVDPTPNRNYAVEGVTADKPTPETDSEAAKAAKERLS